MYEIFKEFTFDAAHHLGANVHQGHMYGQLHGHSFTATVVLRGEPDPGKHWIADLGQLKEALDKVQSELDHRYLNDIKGLEISTMENICFWIWTKLKPEFPSLYRVEVKRGTLGEGARYQETD